MVVEWEIVKQKEDAVYDISPDANVYALCINGVVQITVTVDDILAGLYDLNPEIVRCKHTTTPGMTIEEARV